MQLSWFTLVFIVAGAFIVWFWQDSLRVRDRANAAAMEACTRLALQFLDGTVAFSHLRLVRDAGQLRLRRTYIFDYTAHSIERLQGFVVLLGMRVESVGFARNEAQRPVPSFRADIVAEQPPTVQVHAPGSGAEQGNANNVSDLTEWRRNRNLH